jgi:hypothetical protein
VNPRQSNRQNLQRLRIHGSTVRSASEFSPLHLGPESAAARRSVCGVSALISNVSRTIIVNITSAKPDGCRLRLLKDDILHLSTAKRLRTLLSDDPTDRVGDVALSASVRPDNGRYPLPSKRISVGSQKDLKPWMNSFSILSILFYKNHNWLRLK